MSISHERIARKVQVSASTIQHLLSGRRNASAPLADRLASLTGSPLRIWLRGGDIPSRYRALHQGRALDPSPHGLGASRAFDGFGADVSSADRGTAAKAVGAACADQPWWKEEQAGADEMAIAAEPGLYGGQGEENAMPV